MLTVFLNHSVRFLDSSIPSDVQGPVGSDSLAPLSLVPPAPGERKGGWRLAVWGQ